MTVRLLGMVLASLVLSEWSYAQNTNTYHTSFYELYTSDQADRKGGAFNLAHRDSIRRQQLDSLVLAHDTLTAWDCYFTAMIYHHGPDTTCSALAIHFMKMAIARDSTISPWLLAAAIDRHLNKKGELQIYGTQYIMSHGDSVWRRPELDTTQVTDAERKALGVRTLEEQRQHVIYLNEHRRKPTKSGN